MVPPGAVSRLRTGRAGAGTLQSWMVPPGAVSRLRTGRAGAGLLTRLVGVVLSPVEPEHVEEITDGRHIDRHVRVVGNRDGIWEIVAAAGGERLQAPVPLDELQHRGVISVGVRDAAPARVLRHRDEGDARPIAEEVD